MSFKAASVIAASVYDGKINGEATVEKVCQIIEEAANNGAKLIAFPETFIPIFPWWVYMAVTFTKQNELYRELLKNSYAIDSPQIKKIAEVCKKCEMVAVVGLNEREGSSIYNAQVYIDQGKILGAHRKLVPTAGERSVWGQGDGSGVRVFDTSVGKIGSLICYEHSMALARYALYTMGEQIHVANFPGANFKSQPRDRNKTIDAIIRNVAFEGQVFVLNSTTTLSREECDWYLELDPNNQGVLEPGGGIAAIVDPNCNYIGGPLEHQEGIVYGEIDLEKILAAKHMVDCLGHYARGDVFTLLFNPRKNKIVDRVSQHVTGYGGLSKEVTEAIEILKKNMGKIQDEEIVAAVEELAKII